MADRSYEIIEIVGTSTKSVEDAICNGVDDAKTKNSNVRWFEVLETRGHIEAGKIGHFQVHLRIGAALST